MWGELHNREPLENMVTIHDSERIPVKQSDRKPGPYPYYGASGITDYVHDYLFDGDYVLLAEDGDNLRSRNTPIAFMARGKFWVNNHAHILKGKNGNNTNFICYALQIADLSSYISGSTRPKITQKDMRRIPVFCPPVSDQKSIARILGYLDDKIELNRRMDATLEAMARALFKSWFVDFDPVIDNALAVGSPIPESLQARAETRKALGDKRKHLPESIQRQFPSSFVVSEEMGWIPERWKCGVIGDICSPAIGGQWGSDDPEEGLVPAICLRGADMESLRIDGYAPKAPVRYVKKSAIEKRLPSNVDLLVAGSGAGPCGRPLWFSDALKELYFPPVIYSNFVKRFTTSGREYAMYLDRVLINKYRDGSIQDFITGTSVPNLDASGLLSGCNALIPSHSVLTVFAVQLDGIYSKLYSEESQTLAKLRDQLLPRLLSGQLRISDAEKLIADAV